MKKKVLSTVLALVLFLYFIPTYLSVPARAGGVLDPSIRIEFEEDGESIDFNPRTQSEPLHGDGWSYVPSSKTLTLDGLKCHYLGVYRAIDTRIVLKGENVCSQLSLLDAGGDEHDRATITGDGTLATERIYTYIDLTIESGTITLDGNLEVDRSNVIFTMSGGTLNISSVDGITLDGTFRMTGGVLNVIGTSYGIISSGITPARLYFAGGTATVQGDKAAILLKSSISRKAPSISGGKLIGGETEDDTQKLSVCKGDDEKAQYRTIAESEFIVGEGDLSDWIESSGAAKYVHITGEIPTFTVSYAPNGGTGQMPDSIVTGGEDFTFPECSFTAPEGKEFIGWNIEDKGNVVLGFEGEHYIITEDITFLAIWYDLDDDWEDPDFPDVYTITFDTVGYGNVETMTTDEDGTLSHLPNPTRQGYTFNGWYLTDGIRVTKDTVFTTDTTVYARWTENKTPSRPSSSNTSNKNSSSKSNYSISVPSQSTGGTVYVTPMEASEGSRVTITVKPDDGYKAGSVIVTDTGGKSIAVTKKEDNKYTFTMPESKVDVKVEFTRIELSDVTTSTVSFKDIQSDAYYYDAVNFAYENGLMVGTSETTFAPNVAASRGMIVTILHQLAGKPESDGSYFADVPINRYYAKAAAWAAEQGIISGYGDGRFGPNNPVTREQIVMILKKYVEYKEMDTDKRGDLSQFSDRTSISAGMEEAMSWAVAEGLISGKGNGILDPKGSATRAEVAAILMKFNDLIEK